MNVQQYFIPMLQYSKLKHILEYTFRQDNMEYSGDLISVKVM